MNYRLWVCQTCGAYFNVAERYPDGSNIDSVWDGRGFDAVNRNVTCCNDPSLNWSDSIRVRSLISQDLPIFDNMDLDDNVSDFPHLHIERKVDRFESILKDMERK